MRPLYFLIVYTTGTVIWLFSPIWGERELGDRDACVENEQMEKIRGRRPSKLANSLQARQKQKESTVLCTTCTHYIECSLYGELTVLYTILVLH